jgi:hypothetical protein
VVNAAAVVKRPPALSGTPQVLVELEPAGHAATDLSGDAGAVGRLLVGGPKGGPLAPCLPHRSLCCATFYKLEPLAGRGDCDREVACRSQV